MASVPPSSVSGSRSDATELGAPLSKEILIVIDSFKKRVEEERVISVQKRMEINKIKLGCSTNQLFTLSKDRTSNHLMTNSESLLTRRQMDVLGMHMSVDATNADKIVHVYSEDGSNGTAKNQVRLIKLPEVKKLPPYTSWIFLDRNQRMTEDQSVVGRRRIYYDQNGGEALICSDSEEEAADDDEEKREFIESEDYVIRMTVKEVGFHDSVVESLAQSLSRPLSEVKARIEAICKDDVIKKTKTGENDVQIDNSNSDKDLDAALDSFDNLFCRRCLVFDCRLHGCSQDLIFPVEKQSLWPQPELESVSCGPHCYKVALKAEETPANPSETEARKSHRRKPPERKKPKALRSESASSNAKDNSESSDSEMDQTGNTSNNQTSTSKTKNPKKAAALQRNSKRVAERVITCIRKRQRKTVTSDSDSVPSAGISPPNTATQPSTSDDSTNKAQILNPEETSSNWKPLEKSLLEKGVHIFGTNSCLIARNLLSGLRTCSEVHQYMTVSSNGQACVNSDVGAALEGYSKYELNGPMGNEVRRRSRFLRRRGRVRRLKYSWKSTAYHSIRKRISERKDQPCRQYNPCSCQNACGNQCSCLLNGTCCEKYCGCFKTCKNRFRGCHCAKSQCRSRQCPCFAADRECDPDVCRNCWVSCGDGSLGFPGQRGDNYECRNMKLLLKQQQRVLLGRSDVSGWGAFLKNSVAKHEYLGEYTGELISHREADKRGKIYDRENSSFLFNLNDQFVLDAYRKGDKLKFANHSPDPNCYAKVIMVAGDHRVGIFAKERINAGEELFYDYRYEPDRAPAWARKPEASGSKKDEPIHSTGRAKKLA